MNQCFEQISWIIDLMTQFIPRFVPEKIYFSEHIIKSHLSPLIGVTIQPATEKPEAHK